jgi:hypothetical protein
MRRTKHVELDGQPKSKTIGKKGIERDGNLAGEERESRTKIIARQRAVSWWSGHGGLEERLESSSRLAKRRRDAGLRSGETLRTKSRHDREKRRWSEETSRAEDMGKPCPTEGSRDAWRSGTRGGERRAEL